MLGKFEYASKIDALYTSSRLNIVNGLLDSTTLRFFPPKKSISTKKFKFFEKVTNLSIVRCRKKRIIIFIFVVPKHPQSEHIRVFVQFGIQHESINITAMPRLRFMLFYRHNHNVRRIDIGNHLQLILV